MARKPCKVEQIIANLREAKVELAKGARTPAKRSLWEKTQMWQRLRECVQNEAKRDKIPQLGPWPAHNRTVPGSNPGGPIHLRRTIS